MLQRSRKQLIGWRELVDIPAWGIHGLKAKIDTGARTSALHVDNIVELDENHIEFVVILSRKNTKKRIKVRARAVKRGWVRASHGRTTRWYIETRIKIGPLECVIPLNLVDRSAMIYRMLLGRNAIEGSFIVDVSKSYTLERSS